MMEGNPYATEDALYTEDANNSATVSATMALVFEQRLANLIAYRAAQGEAIKNGWPMSQAIAEQIEKADARITEGLNLESRSSHICQECGEDLGMNLLGVPCVTCRTRKFEG